MGALVAFAIAVIATPLARRAASTLGVLDVPGPLKVQRRPVAYLGGAAVFVAIATLLVPTEPAWIIPLALATLLGLADDVRALSPLFRLASQATIGVVAGLVVPAPGPAGLLVTAALVMVLTNAVNLIDGMDTLASTTVMVSALGFIALGGDGRVLALALAGALAGFLIYNWPPASIYLGDAGAYLLGTALGMLAAASLDSSATSWIAVPFLVALPVADGAIAIVRRRLAHRPIMAGDRSHIYDQLADRGWPILRVVALCAAVQAIATGVGVAIWHAQPVPAVALAVMTTALALVVVWKSRLVRPGAFT